MKKKDRVFNYLLSVGFILIIVFLLLMLLLISRFVLSGVNPIGAHVLETKNLLDDVAGVERAATQNIENVNRTEKTERSFVEFNDLPTNVKDISYLNINESKSILTIIVDDNIYERNGHYYLVLDNLSEVNKFDMIVYNVSGEVGIGSVVAVENEVFHVMANEKIEKLPYFNVVGKVFYVKDD